MSRFLPVAPRPFEDELLSSWQERVACRYGCPVSEIERWLGHDRGHGREWSFARRDFQPDAATTTLWARACRMRAGELERLALARFARPASWYVGKSWRRGMCLDCLDEDAACGRDHYVRRAWSHVETAICPRHRRMLQDFCRRCFAQGRFWFACVKERATLVCAQCATTVSGRMTGIEEPAELDFLLALTAAVRATIAGKERRAALDEITAAVQVLWAPSQANGKPFIAWLDLKRPFGRLPVFTVRCDPLASLSLSWRIVTLTAAAQLLDLVQARRRFGPPPVFLEREFAEFRGGSIPQTALPSNSARGEGTASKLRLRSDFEYRRMAEQIVTGAEWKAISNTKGRSRDRQLRRLMTQALDRERARSDGPRPAGP
ncbi:TniQ family protein (plasmid) [Ensifer adhaerens]|uniref:TniQ family protein n=2 Tax=Ensifer adhaerens TaxID=106592 RepID=UPI001CBF1723|nr:TniQ family protein [Ensifer adhaerens]